MSELPVQDRTGGVRFRVRVQPRASRSDIDGVRDGVLRVRLMNPPVDGAANEALVELLADTLDVAKRSVHIVAGATSRTKVIDVDGLDRDRVRERLARWTTDDHR
ncbi:MAG TPA: DUF167 domain-containing protein [Gemmatimonadaceae bacterium]|nr:DUF167 domain-containing protein [Gemmatimonadaceae bacterium]